jgi:hypothetical protein
MSRPADEVRVGGYLSEGAAGAKLDVKVHPRADYSLDIDGHYEVVHQVQVHNYAAGRIENRVGRVRAQTDVEMAYGSVHWLRDQGETVDQKAGLLYHEMRSAKQSVLDHSNNIQMGRWCIDKHRLGECGFMLLTSGPLERSSLSLSLSQSSSLLAYPLLGSSRP